MICVNSIQLYPSLIYVRKGEWNYDAYVEIDPANATNQSIYWHSADSSIASVNPSTGYIYGVSEGTTTIYASAQDGSGKKDCCTVTVTQNVPITSIILNQTALSLEVGTGTSLAASISPTNATNKSLTWRSSNTVVATVAEGYVCAKSTGTARITACANDGSGQWAACDVTVSGDVLVYSVVVEPESKTMTVGETAYLSATVYPAHATNQNLVWTSGNSNVATVNPNSGLVMAQNAGITNVYATAQDGSGKSDSCSITVNAPVAVESIEIYQKDFTINVGETKDLCAIISPTNATNRRVHWCSSDSSIACVNYHTGSLCAKSPGKVTITATSADGEKTDSITVTVIIDTVTIEKDGDFNRVIFNSTGKIWRCLNHDLIYTDRTQGDPEEQMLNDILWSRSNYNFFTYFEEGIQNPDTTPKEYTDDEIKLLYAIDPYGVAHYVQRYATARDGGLETCLEYKDRIFQLLFKREPKYFARTLSGKWYETTDKSDLTDVLSESEQLFGLHPIYYLVTLLEFIGVVLDIASLMLGPIDFKNMSKKEGLKLIAKIGILAFGLGEAFVKEEVISNIINEVVSVALQNTPLEWAYNCVTFYSDFNDLADSLIVKPNYCKGILDYCANDTGYCVFLKLKNGQTHRIDELCDAIKE